MARWAIWNGSRSVANKAQDPPIATDTSGGWPSIRGRTHARFDGMGPLAMTASPVVTRLLSSHLMMREPAYTAMIHHLAACLPYEGVGLISVVNAPEGIVGERYYAGRNADASWTRYTMNPDDVSAALREMERGGTWLGAIAHSHPRTAPVPSRYDLEEADVQGVLHLIVGFEPTIAVRAWRLLFNERGEAKEAEEVGITILPDPHEPFALA